MFVLLNSSSYLIYAQENSKTVRLVLGETGSYATIERSDLSRYDDGSYTGHVFREVRAFLRPVSERSYGGEILVLEETIRDLRDSAKKVDKILTVEFSMDTLGGMHIVQDEGYPSLRGFPAFPRDPVAPGETWVSKGSRAVDPRNEGIFVVLPIVVQYQYRGMEEYKGVPVHRIFAKYATRYQAAGRAQTFVKAMGTHEVDILIRVSDGLTLLMRDRLDETFTWPDDSSTGFRGFSLSFGQGIGFYDRTEIITNMKNDLDELRSDLKEDPEIEVSSAPQGIRLTVNKLRFLPDSDRLLPDEQGRLDLLAQTLKDLGDRNILVEGHTAAVGKEAGEQALSLARAKRIVDEMSARGIKADRFLYKGWGGTKPLADNSTEEGRARNRRVELTILD